MNNKILPTHAGTIPLYFQQPSGASRGTVVVLHPAHGITPEIHGWLATLAAEGYLALAPVLHYRRGTEIIDPMSEFDGDLSRFSASLPTDEQFLEDFGSLLESLDVDFGVSPDEVSVVGFSYGGRAAYLAASRFPISSAVSWYPVGIHLKNFDGNSGLPALDLDKQTPAVPWLGLVGTEDTLYAPDELVSWQQAIDDLGNRHVELISYPGAGHAFDNKEGPFPGAPSPYNASAFEDAWRRTRTHLAAHHSSEELQP